MVRKIKTTVNKKPVKQFVREKKAKIQKAKVGGDPQAKRTVEQLFKEYVKTNSLAAPKKRKFAHKPDLVGNIEDIERLFPSTSGKIRRREGVAGVSFLQKDPNQEGINLSSFNLNKKETASFKDEFGKRNISKAKLKEYILNTPELHDRVKKVLMDKHDNFAVIHSSDDGKPTTTFLPNSLKTLGLLKLNNLDITSNIIEDKKGNIKVDLNLKLKDNVYKKYLQSAQDVTEEFHRGLAKHTSVKFHDFVKKKIGKSKKDLDIAVLALAAEFDKEAGRKSKVTYKTKLKRNIDRFAKAAVVYDSKGRSRQLFLSSAQFSALVRQRLGSTMGRVGLPQPPWMKERSGRFRSSINVFPNYRSGEIKYSFMQLYSQNQDYGYQVYDQIENAIRDVAKTAFKRAFRIEPVDGKRSYPGYLV